MDKGFQRGTKKTKRRNQMSNEEIIEDFIDEIRDMVLTEETLEIVNALKDILLERKQDKKRIEELEEKNRVLCEEYCPKIVRIKELEEALLKVKDKNTTLFITCRNSIPKQEVKDLIKNGTINISGFECIAVEDIEELLEEK